jgi:hypothetical protein
VVGVPDTQIDKAEPMPGPVRFDTASDRSVQGSINIVRQDLQAWVFQLPNVTDANMLKVSTWLNERPVTIRRSATSSSAMGKSHTNRHSSLGRALRRRVEPQASVAVDDPVIAFAFLEK